MRIYGSNGAALPTPAASTRRPGAGGFSVSQGEAPRQSAPSAALRTVGGIDALIALQGVEEPGERRRRAVKRGRTVLDVLDDIKLGLLSGRLDASAFLRLKSVMTDLKDASGDANLDQVLAEIELRAEVELAKAGVR